MFYFSNNNKLIYLLLNLSLIYCKQNINKNKSSFRCAIDKHNFFKGYLDHISPIEIKNFFQYNDNNKENEYKDFNINIDLYNFYDELEKYKLTSRKNFFESALIKIKNVYEKLLKVKILPNDNIVTDQQIINLKIKNWDKSKVGNEARKKNKGLKSQGIDLYIFVRFGDNKELGESVLAVAGSSYLDSKTSQPIVGIVVINREVNYNKINSLRYLEGILLHEFTHILGFHYLFFQNVYNYYFTEIGNDGIKRGYLNSTKLLQVAKKYYNCDNINGVQLEEYGGEVTAGSHWESRILLGEYMIGEIYPEEQVISEFTLALLEDLKFYKAKYYTGGLMKFGKNKGCEFLYNNCVINKKVNPKFKNEFFDQAKDIKDPSCSSGRQSRVYKILASYKVPLPKHYQYFGKEYIGGTKAIADYCPIFVNNPFEQDEEIKNIHYIGHCSEIGSGRYGKNIPYRISNYETKYFENGEIEKYTGEIYSPNSFCVLSSLISKNINNYEQYSKTTRAICYQMFCSDKSLTIQINNDYIVCPRDGGKIKLPNYDGYLLCPDYYLICSGTVLCNDIFDCIEKQSELKDIKYDYEIKTTQDIIDAEKSDFSENYYELSNNGVCPQYCVYCNFNSCLKCKDDYGILEIKENDINKRICIKLDELKNGYYKSDKEQIYYKCLNNCDKCNNGNECFECKMGFKLSDGKNLCEEESKNKFSVFIIVSGIFAILLIVIFFIIKAHRKNSGGTLEFNNRMYINEKFF